MNTPRLRHVLPLATAIFAVAALPTVPEGPLVGPVGPGFFATANANLELNIPINSGTAGARLVDDTLLVSDQNGLTVYDASDPSLPVVQGFVAIPQQYYFTEEDVPSNGEIALIGQFGDLTPSIRLNVVDVTLDDNLGGQPMVIGTLEGLDEHTFECARDCTYAYGSAGAIIDLTDPTNPTDIGEWDDAVKAQIDPATGDAYAFKASTHDVTEIAPGILLTSSNPMFLLDIRETPATPKVIGTGSFTDNRFIHASLWPYHGALPLDAANPAADGWEPDWNAFDKHVLVGGETAPLGFGCGKDDGAFMTMSWTRTANDATAGGEPDADAGMVRMVFDPNNGDGDEYKPEGGTFTDGGSPYSQYCTHWFTTKPGYRDGGLLAMGWYEFGVRFLEIADDGGISETGWLIPMGGSTSAAYWADDDTILTADYQRGVDILSYDSEMDVDPTQHEEHDGLRFTRVAVDAPDVVRNMFTGYGCPLPS
jgi:hypothetical protein